MSSAALRRVRAWVWILSLTAALPARAEPAYDEVVLSGDVGEDAFEVLRTAFARDGTQLRRGVASAGCAGTLADANPRARVSIDWHAGAPLELCFQDACRSAQRTLGPFTKLDARAREEIITVVELGLAALRCAAPDAPPAATSTAQPASNASQGARAASEALGSRTVTRTPATTSLPELQEVEAPRESAPAAPARTPDREADTSHAAASGERDSSAGRHAFAFGASYGLTRWTPSVFAHSVSGMVAYAVHTMPLFVGLELGYAPHFSSIDRGLAVEGSCVRLALALWTRWTLSERLALDAQLGPAVEWLSLEPASTQRPLDDPHETSHADPLLFARLGPTVRVAGPLSIGLALQVDASWIQRSFGFMTSTGPQAVFTPDRVRLSLAINARAEL